MALKFRLKGLAETFVDSIKCPSCNYDGGNEAEESFSTGHTRVTFEGIIVVMECPCCGLVFYPEGQKIGIVNPKKLRTAVERDYAEVPGAIVPTIEEIKLDIEKLNAERNDQVH